MLALTWTPGLSLVLLRDRDKKEGEGAHAAGRFLTRVLHVHRQVLDWSLAKPLWLGGACLLLVVATFIGYKALGSDLLPEMDEGGFILDYIMPAGSSLEETNRVLEHVDRILHATPEVESTSRRTGLQMGLAAVTEANTGDFTVKLKAKRSRGIDDVMEDVRTRIRTSEPELDIEFTQVLQDMIGDLSNAPEPIQIKIFSDDPTMLNQLGPRVGDAIGKIRGVVDVQDGIENTISGPATNFQVNPVVAAGWGSRLLRCHKTPPPSWMVCLPTIRSSQTEDRTPFAYALATRTVIRSTRSRTLSSTAVWGTRPRWAHCQPSKSCPRRMRSGVKICNASSS